MKTKSLLILLTALLSCLSFARGGDHVDNGGGIAEKNVLYAYNNLSKYLNLCIHAEGCKLSPKQKQLLKKIAESLPAEYQDKEQLKFLSEKKNPGFFIIDGEVKVAKTGDSIGSPIFVNTDLLFQKDADGTFIPTSLSEAVAILVHEFGHHHGNWSHDELDLIGVKTSLMLNQKVYSSPLIPWATDLQLTVVNYNVNNSFPDVLLAIGEDLIDLSERYKKTVRCPTLTLPIPILPIPDLDLAWTPARGSILHNLHWTQMNKDKKNSENQNIPRLEIRGNITKKCEHKNLFFLNMNHKLSLSFEIEKVNGKWTLKEDSVLMDQMNNPWWKIIRLPGI